MKVKTFQIHNNKLNPITKRKVMIQTRVQWQCTHERNHRVYVCRNLEVATQTADHHAIHNKVQQATRALFRLLSLLRSVYIG